MRVLRAAVVAVGLLSIAIAPRVLAVSVPGYAILGAKNAALCIADFGDKTTPLRSTANHGYFRLRDEGYKTADLEQWADRLIERGQNWRDAFVYFKHEERGTGPRFAEQFRTMAVPEGAST